MSDCSLYTPCGEAEIVPPFKGMKEHKEGGFVWKRCIVHKKKNMSPEMNPSSAVTIFSPAYTAPQILLQVITC